MAWPLLTTAILSGLLSILLTPMVMRIMTRAGLVDHPDGNRKLHARSVPLAGGLAIWIAAVIAMAGAAYLYEWIILAEERGFWLSFLAATGLICLVGLADDAWNLRGRHKLFGQILACMVMITGGLVIHSIQLFGMHISLGIFAIPFTLFWLLGAVNAMNLVDGMDGMASTIGGIIGLALCLMAAMTGHLGESLAMAALVGGILGFLVYNLPPARVFLGDTGSMMIGLVLGVVAVRASLKEPTTIALAAPITIWTLPILDAFMAILRRRLTGRSILIPDRAHLHHRLSEYGLTAGKSLMLIAALTAITTTAALMSVLWSAEWIGPIVAIAVTMFLALARLFGHSELALLARCSRSFLHSMIPFKIANSAGQEHRSRIQGTTEWDRLWESLLRFGELCELNSIQLSINLPAFHEQFFARWNRRRGPDWGAECQAEIPLSSPVLGSIGSLRISGHPDGDSKSSCLWISEMIEGLHPFEVQICDLLNRTVMSSTAERETASATVFNTPLTREQTPNLVGAVNSAPSRTATDTSAAVDVCP